MYHIILNPSSRSGYSKTIWETVIEPHLQERGIEYEVHFSVAKGSLTELVWEITSKATKEEIQIILLGGDGTINEALQKMENMQNVTIGYIPTGSSNDLARDLGIPKDPLKALELILDKKTVHPMDIALLTFPNGETRRFAVSCGTGFDAAVCEATNRSKMKAFMNKFGLGKLAYMGIAIKILFFAKKITCDMTLDNEPTIHMNKFLFSAIMVHRYEGGGFKFCPSADHTDGILDICTVSRVPRWLVLIAIPTAFGGKHYMFSGVDPHAAKKVHIKMSSPTWIHTDGEILGQSDELTIECLQQAIRLIY